MAALLLAERRAPIKRDAAFAPVALASPLRLLLGAAPLTPPDTHPPAAYSHRVVVGTPATWKGFAERPSAPVAATATAAGDAAVGRSARRRRWRQGQHQEAAAEAGRGGGEAGRACAARPRGMDALVGAAPPVGDVPPAALQPARWGTTAAASVASIRQSNQNNVNVNVNYPGGGGCPAATIQAAEAAATIQAAAPWRSRGYPTAVEARRRTSAAAVGGGSAASRWWLCGCGSGAGGGRSGGGTSSGGFVALAVGATVGAPPPAASALAVEATVGAPPPAAMTGSGSSEHESGGEAADDDIEDTDGIIGGCGSHDRTAMDSIPLASASMPCMKGTRAGAGLRCV